MDRGRAVWVEVWYICFCVRIHQDALEGPGISRIVDFICIPFLAKAASGPRDPQLQGSPLGCFIARAFVPRLWNFRSRAKRCVLKVSSIIMTNVYPRSENYSFRDRPGEVPHGNAGIKSTTSMNLTYLVIALTPSTDVQDLLNNDNDVSERQVEGLLCVKNNKSSFCVYKSIDF